MANNFHPWYWYFASTMMQMNYLNLCYHVASVAWLEESSLTHHHCHQFQSHNLCLKFIQELKVKYENKHLLLTIGIKRAGTYI